MRKIIFLTSIMLMAMLAIPVAQAQDETGAASSATTDNTEIPASQVASQEAMQDESVTEEDLGVKTPGRFHFLTRIKRTVQRAITADPIKEARLDIDEAHEELLIARKIAEENPGDEKASEKAQQAIAKFEQKISDVKDRAQEIKEKKADQAGAFLEKIADMQIKQQKMLDQLEEKLPEQAFERIQQARERSLEHAAEVFTKVAENKEQIAERINAAMEKQEGSEFKDFKNMEIMERLREHMPDEAKAAIEQAQNQARERFEEKMRESTSEDLNQKFETYIENIKGNAVQQFKVLQEIKTEGNIGQIFTKQIDAAQKQTIIKFEQRIQNLQDPAQREAYLENIKNGDVKNVQTMEQLREHVPADIKVEFDQAQNKALENIKIKLEQTENPEAFDFIKSQLEANPAVQRTIQKQYSDFNSNLQIKQKEIEQIKTRAMERTREQMQEREQEMEDRPTEAQFKEPIENPEPVACTMEYDPVCGVDGKTYSNACNAEKQARVKIQYKGECKTETERPTNTGQVQPGGKTPPNNTPKPPTNINISPRNLGGHGRIDPEETGLSEPPANPRSDPTLPAKQIQPSDEALSPATPR